MAQRWREMEGWREEGQNASAEGRRRVGAAGGRREDIGDTGEEREREGGRGERGGGGDIVQMETFSLDRAACVCVCACGCVVTSYECHN